MQYHEFANPEASKSEAMSGYEFAVDIQSMSVKLTGFYDNGELVMLGRVIAEASRNHATKAWVELVKDDASGLDRYDVKAWVGGHLLFNNPVYGIHQARAFLERWVVRGCDFGWMRPDMQAHILRPEDVDSLARTVTVARPLLPLPQPAKPIEPDGT